MLTRTQHTDDVGDATDSTKWDDGKDSGLLCKASAHQGNGMQPSMRQLSYGLSCIVSLDHKVPLMLLQFPLASTPKPVNARFVN